MEGLILFVAAMVVSMTIVPIMIRIAPHVGMVDLPDARKVHSMPIPRVGGIGIVIGALLPIVFWLPFDPLFSSYVFGCLVLLVFGVWDDSCELGHYVKFIGQFLSVIPIVYYADLYVSVLPLIGEISEVTGKIFTVIAIVGMINAINHSDGLDGLAGGMTLMSLVCIAYLFYLADDFQMLLLCLSVMGGIFGFLRFNSHPAKVFMGDGGSQFLGLTLGFLAVYLTQRSNPALSPALPVLFLGLPIVDILAVFYLRISGGMNWFRATRNHVHHRLLDLGFTHYESVIFIYFIQMFLIVSAILFMYEYDALNLSIYFAVTVFVFSCLTFLERKGYKVKRSESASIIDNFINNRLKSRRAFEFVGYYIAGSITLLFLYVSLSSGDFSLDLGYLSAFIITAAVIIYVFCKKYIQLLSKLAIYITAVVIVYLDYLLIKNSGEKIFNLEIIVFVSIGFAIAFLIKFDEGVEFNMSPMDYLVFIIVILAIAVFSTTPDTINYSGSILKLMVLFYGCELIDRKSYKGLNVMAISAFASHLILLSRAVI
ncbi:MAG: undecaprenyl/decaprenyl-phosphate alpha-N-acetylglucosaminyl 1-phosphate transferase [Gammaproteobacteria bacterium]|nr:undecaprenyl/decaprenyl-phosphate alpha-N-acetylglucosaminyl 1-phosphate transferase [Gammaproteobacteria bacterium]